jgi:hypothetical protein
VSKVEFRVKRARVSKERTSVQLESVRGCGVDGAFAITESGARAVAASEGVVVVVLPESGAGADAGAY